MEDDIKKIMLVLIVVVAIILVGMFGWAISTHNKLVDEEEAIDSAWAQVTNVYQLKIDKIPQLLNLTDAYLNWEASTYTNITALRSQWMAAKDDGDVGAMENTSIEMDRQIDAIVLTVENYPGLDGIVVVSTMMYEIAEMENTIMVERMRYNEDVQDFNAHIKKFPASWVAERGDFEEREYYLSDAGPAAP